MKNHASSLRFDLLCGIRIIVDHCTPTPLLYLLSWCAAVSDGRSATPRRCNIDPASICYITGRLQQACVPLFHGRHSPRWLITNPQSSRSLGRIPLHAAAVTVQYTTWYRSQRTLDTTRWQWRHYKSPREHHYRTKLIRLVLILEFINSIFLVFLSPFLLNLSRSWPLWWGHSCIDWILS